MAKPRGKNWRQERDEDSSSEELDRERRRGYSPDSKYKRRSRRRSPKSDSDSRDSSSPRRRGRRVRRRSSEYYNGNVGDAGWGHEHADGWHTRMLHDNRFHTMQRPHYSLDHPPLRHDYHPAHGIETPPPYWAGRRGHRGGMKVSQMRMRPQRDDLSDAPREIYGPSAFKRRDQNGGRRRKSPPVWASHRPPVLKAENFKPYIRDTHRPAPTVLKMTQTEADCFRGKHKIRLECPFDVTPPNPCVLFELVGFRSEVTAKLSSRYGAPTSIQAQGWPVVCCGHNLVAVGETGTGKTLTFMLPLASHLEANADILPMELAKPRGLIVAPTRELCCQIQEEAREYLHPYAYYSIVLIGGQSRQSQESSLSHQRTHVVVATPARLLDFVTREKLSLRDVTYWVLDEADRLLDEGFSADILLIGQYIRPDRQTLLWTATWSPALNILANRIFDRPPVRMTIGTDEAHTIDTIQHRFVTVNRSEDRINALLDFLRDKAEYRVIVFTTKRIDCPMIEAQIKQELPTHLCAIIHGDQRQEEREKVMKSFEEGLINIIISTNLIGRGIDFKRVYAVVNYGIPREISDYVNQCGRTGRAGADGIAVTLLVAGEENPAQLDALERVLTASEVEIPDELRAARTKPTVVPYADVVVPWQGTGTAGDGAEWPVNGTDDLPDWAADAGAGPDTTEAGEKGDPWEFENSPMDTPWRNSDSYSDDITPNPESPNTSFDGPAGGAQKETNDPSVPT